MKILCVSDYVDPLIYNPKAKEFFPDIDLILCAGDLPMDYIDYIVTIFNKPTYFIFGNHNLKEFHHYHKNADAFMAPTADRFGENYHYCGATYAGFKSIADFNLSFYEPSTGKRTPLLITGISGSLKYNNGLNQYSDRHMYFKLLMLIPSLIKNKIKYGRYTDIFLTHASPRHIHDHEDPCHKGFDCFNWFLQKFHPTYMVHGHIHLYDMREERCGVYYGTNVVNAYAHWVIEFPMTSNNSESEKTAENADKSQTLTSDIRN